MNNRQLPQIPEWLSAALASDAVEGRGVMAGTVCALKPEIRAVGPAVIAVGSQDDNQVLRHLMAAKPPLSGCILVVGGQGTSRTATIGGLMALEIKNAGAVGLVTDGLVRDSQEIRQLDFPVWCRGVTPTASNKLEQGVIGGSVTIAGALVREGDLIIADEDGVVIWPEEEIDHLLVKAKEKYDADNARLARLEATAKE